ncbi:MAG: GGDEF domain-containing protein [Lachnospiraceae bacterium]|nr:GGDEF domain-containing protein [Lachnospiraceae bacterium]
MVKELRRHNILLFLIHAVFLLFFLITRIYLMAYINIFSVTAYLLNLYILEKEHYRLAFNVVYFEILFHSIFGIIILGHSSGFIMLAIAVVPFIVYYDRLLSLYQSEGVRYPEYFGFMAGAVAVAEVISWKLPPLYKVPQEVYDGLRLALFILVVIDFYYVMVKLMGTVRSAENRLREQKSILERVSKQDALTGMENRRGIMEYLTRATTSGTQFAVIMLDIDNFKQVNDTHGHDCGDFVLIKVSNIINSCVRKCDVVSRWGGEEVLIYLPGCDAGDVVIIAERIRSTVESEMFIYNGRSFKITVTIGTEVSEKHDSIEGIIKVADERLYRGKNSGRNRVVSC